MKTAFLFPGQGAQYVGMGSALASSLPAAKALFDQASAVLGYDLLGVCANGPAEKLNATDVSQPAIFVASLAALESLKQSEPAAANDAIATAGLSLGEYTALVFAGAMSFADGLAVVRERGRAMQAAAVATPSGMVSALLLDLPKVEEVVQETGAAGRIWIANYLCPGNTVLSGEIAAIAAAEKVIESQGGKADTATRRGGVSHGLDETCRSGACSCPCEGRDSSRRRYRSGRMSMLNRTAIRARFAVCLSVKY